jgi:hypothetical protein
MTDRQWYAVPGGKWEDDKIVNENGELVATFEYLDHAEIAAALYNQEFSNKNQIKEDE